MIVPPVADRCRLLTFIVQMPAVAQGCRTLKWQDPIDFPGSAPPRAIDASFSIVTRSPAAVTLGQRLPHYDALAPERVALVHYLVPGGTDGTAFFRHRSTGFETIDQTRAGPYREQLAADLRVHPRPVGYTAADTPLFERTAVADGMFNRALLYCSFLLHSGAIAGDARLPPDPAEGRLTVTAFSRSSEFGRRGRDRQ